MSRIGDSPFINSLKVESLKTNVSEIATEGKKALAEAKNAAVIGKRTAEAKLGMSLSKPSLSKLFPSELKGLMKDARETVTQNYISRGFSKAFKSTLHTEEPNLDHKITKTLHVANKEGPPRLDSSKMIASQEEIEAFKNSRESGLIASHFKASHADVNGKVATGVRERLNHQLQSVKEGKFDGVRSKRDKNKAENYIKQASESKLLPNARVDTLKSKRLEVELHKMGKEGRNQLSSLHDEELIALQMYTAEGDYRLVNHVLDGDQRNLATWLENRKFTVPGSEQKKFYRELSDSQKQIVDEELHQTANQVIDLTASALNKLPQYDGKVYRSVRMAPNELAKYQRSGEVLVSKKFLSTTKSLEQAENFDITGTKTDDQGVPMMKVIYQIESSPGEKLRGADITHLSAKEEEEVLLNLGSVFVSTGYEEVPAKNNADGVPQEGYVIIKFRQLTEKEISG